MHSDYLLTVAEIAIALAGFAGLIIAVFGIRDRTPEQEELDISFLKNILGTSFMAIGFSFFPATLIEMGVADSLVWRISSGVAGITFATYVLFHVPRMRKTFRLAGKPFPWTYWMNTSFAVVVVAIAACIAAGWLPSVGYFSILVYTLYAACFSFARVFTSITQRGAS